MSNATARITFALQACGLPASAVESLVDKLLHPVPGTIDPAEVKQADDTRLILLATIVSLTSIRDQQTPRLLLDWLASRESDLNTYDRGRFWHLHGYLAWRQNGNVPRSYTALNRSIRLLETLPETAAQGYLARVWDTFGQLLQHQGLVSAAVHDYQRALDLKLGCDDEAGAALTLGNLGRSSMELGNFSQAADYFHQDVCIVERLMPDLTDLRIQLYSHLANCLLELGQTQAARDKFVQCLEMAPTQLTTASGFAHIGLARVALAEKALNEAQRQLNLARSCESANCRFPGLAQELIANTAHVSGDVYYAQGETASAGLAYRKSLDHFSASPTASPVEHARLLHKLARMELEDNRHLEAAKLLRDALQKLDATAMEQLRNEVEDELRNASREIWLLHSAGRFLGQGQLDLLLELTGNRGFRGEQEEMVILFSDIRGFTSISEHLIPEELVVILNDYLTHMTRCVERFGGIVDKFIGDAVMALFPSDAQNNAAERAARTALMMYSELEHFNRSLPAKMPHFKIGIGLHTGQVVAGLIGSPQKRSYTAIGDPVNTSSRLEGMTKPLGAGILVSHQLASQLPQGQFLLRPLGRFRPKGRTETVEVLELMLEADGSQQERQLNTEINACKTALNSFRQRKFADAQTRWQQLAQSCDNPLRTDGYRFLAQQAQTLRHNPPQNDWQGEIELKEK